MPDGRDHDPRRGGQAGRLSAPTAARALGGSHAGTGKMLVSMAAASCTHLDAIRVTDLPLRIEGCEECLRSGGSWVHLRMCLTCGRIACCDNSPGRHASVHFHRSGHPLIRSAEPDEEWVWCYLDGIPLVLEDGAPPR